VLVNMLHVAEFAATIGQGGAPASRASCTVVTQVVIYVRAEAPSTSELIADAARRFNINIPGVSLLDTSAFGDGPLHWGVCDATSHLDPC
jgi:hypothetical protein